MSGGHVLGDEPENSPTETSFGPTAFVVNGYNQL